MNAKACAPSNAPKNWDSIDWKKTAAYVKKLQMRIAKAQKEGRHNKVKALQWTLTHSFYAKALAIKRVTENRGKKTPGVDKILWTTKKEKWEAITTLKRHGYRPLPLRRVYLRKPNGKLRPLGIPTMTDRAMQTLYKFALEPVAETTGDPNSYGFRMGRCTQDAAVQCTAILARKDRAQWVLEGDIKGCFDNISHDWIEKHIPMDKEILHKFLKCGYIDTGKLFPTQAGTPQGGSISPTIANMVLDGLEFMLNKRFRKHYENGVYVNPKVNLVRYADDFKVRRIIKHSKASTQQELIGKLNPIIRGWALYHAHNASKQTFSMVDNQIWQCLWRWARRRHPKKGGEWIYNRYFHLVEQRVWTFAVPRYSPESTSEYDYILLERASNREIKRFVKIKSEANPFAPEWQMYFEERETDKMRDTLNGRTKLLNIFLRQKGLCAACGRRMTVETGCKVHYLRCGNIRTKQMVHPVCHKKLHTQESVTFEPAPQRSGVSLEA